MNQTPQRYKLICYVPQTHFETVKAAVLGVGCGTMGNYTHCAWSVLGHGQFKPGTNSQAFIGKPEAISIVDEYRFEVICEEKQIKPALEALKSSHPYEVPAFEIIQLCQPELFT